MKKTPTIHKTIERMCRYQFNNSELLELGRKLAESQRNLVELENDKSRVMKDYASRISAEEASGGALGTCISSGYEMRKLACTVALHEPQTGMKTTRRNDTGEILEVAEMAPFERQEELPIDGGEAAADTLVRQAAIEAAAKERWRKVAEKNKATADDSTGEPGAAEAPTGATESALVEKTMPVAVALGNLKACRDLAALQAVVRDADLPTAIRVAAEKQARKVAGKSEIP